MRSLYLRLCSIGVGTFKCNGGGFLHIKRTENGIIEVLFTSDADRHNFIYGNPVFLDIDKGNRVKYVGLLMKNFECVTPFQSEVLIKLMIVKIIKLNK